MCSEFAISFSHLNVFFCFFPFSGAVVSDDNDTGSEVLRISDLVGEGASSALHEDEERFVFFRMIQPWEIVPGEMPASILVGYTGDDNLTDQRSIFLEKAEVAHFSRHLCLRILICQLRGHENLDLRGGEGEESK